MREALNILAARSSHHHEHHDHEHKHDTAEAKSSACCHGAPTEDAVHWGQRIQLGPPDDGDDDHGEGAPRTTAGEESAAATSIAEQKERLEKESAKRRVEIEEKLALLSVAELLHCIMSTQERRVATYRAYDSYVVAAVSVWLSIFSRAFLTHQHSSPCCFFRAQWPRGGSEKRQRVPLSRRLCRGHGVLFGFE